MQVVNQFHVTGLLLYPPENIRELLLSGGIERDQWNKMGYYNLFLQFPHLHPHVIYHLVFVPALLVIFDLVSKYPNSFLFIWSQAN